MVNASTLHISLTLGCTVAPAEIFPIRLPVTQSSFGGGQRRTGIRLVGQPLSHRRLSSGQRCQEFITLFPIQSGLRLHLLQRRRYLSLLVFTPPPQLALVLQILFEPADRRAGLVIAALGSVERLVKFQPLRPSCFKSGFQPALFSQGCIQRSILLPQGLLTGQQVGLQITPAQGKKFRPQPAFFRTVVAVLLGGAGLTLQMLELPGQFAAHIVQALQIFAGMANPGFSLATTLLVLGNAGGLFQKDP